MRIIVFGVFPTAGPYFNLDRRDTVGGITTELTSVLTTAMDVEFPNRKIIKELPFGTF